MSEAASAAAAPAAPAGAPPAAPSANSGFAGTPPPAAGTPPPIPEWASTFKNEELKTHMSKFKTTEALAESYRHLETKVSSQPPADKMIVIPDKMEGDAAKAIYQKLGMPAEAKDYGLPRDEKSPEFADWAEGVFHKNNLTKSQAEGVVKEYETWAKDAWAKTLESQGNLRKQADENLKKEWGPQYDANINLAKQGAKVLGLDAKGIDLLESIQGKEVLFKNLQRIGVSVGESTFVDGGNAPNAGAQTPEQAQAEMKQLMQDKKFAKQFNRGDKEAIDKWNALNIAAAPGTKIIG